MPRRVCFLFGQEGPGLSEAAREVCDGTFSIAQFGSTRSINASAAAAIAMHAWIREYADLSGDDRLARLTLTPGRAELRGIERSGWRVSTSWSLSSPREVWLLTVPVEMPSSWAVSSTDRPSQCRSRTVLRCMTRQRLEGLEHRRPLLDRQRLPRRRVVAVEPRPLAPPRPAVLVDVGADDDLPGVGLLPAVAVQPRPRDVQLDERGLEQVLGLVPVAADGVRDPAQVGLPGGDEGG